MTERHLPNVSIILAFLMMCVTIVSSQNQSELREEFHKTLALNPNGRLSLENINGDVQIKIWDRSEVQLDAVKIANSPERLAEVEIEVNATQEAVNIRTRYPSGASNWKRGSDDRFENPARVQYTLTVPRRAQLQKVELINGALDIDSVEGDVRASTINGRLTARKLTGGVRLSTVNGPVSATFEKLNDVQPIALTSVNGPVELTLPSDASAQITADTVHGQIANNFGLSVRRGEHVGRSLAGSLGQGTSRIKINNVNGKISINRADDRRPMSPVNDSQPQAAGDEDGTPQELGVARERERALAEARREVARARREVERAMNEQKRELQRNLGEQKVSAIRQQAQSEIKRALENTRAAREAVSAAMDNLKESHSGEVSPLIERESKSFPVAAGAVPRIAVETFDGAVIVRSWDKPEVSYTAQKRAHAPEDMSRISIQAEQRGGEIVIAARPLAPGDNVHASVQFEVYVPRNANLRLDSGDGRLDVEGVSGDLQLKTGDGAIHVRDSKGALRAVTGDGRITLDGFDGAAETHSGDGRLALRGRFSRLDARTGDGAISLDLPPDMDAIVETNAESVTSDNSYAAESPDESQRVRRWKSGRGGSVVLMLRTGDGRIVLGRSGGATREN